jgi:hypothetical protein
MQGAATLVVLSAAGRLTDATMPYAEASNIIKRRKARKRKSD